MLQIATWSKVVTILILVIGFLIALPNALPSNNLTEANKVQPGQAYTSAAAATFGQLTSTVGRTVGLGTARRLGIWTLLAHKTLESGPANWAPGLPFTDCSVSTWKVVGPFTRQEDRPYPPGRPRPASHRSAARGGRSRAGARPSARSRSSRHAADRSTVASAA